MSAPVFPCFAYGRKNDEKRRSNSDEKIMKVWNIQIHPIRRTGGKTLAVDCTQTANTEFYIDLGKEYDIYTGAGFSDKTPENFYQKSAAEFRIKLNDTRQVSLIFICSNREGKNTLPRLRISGISEATCG